MALRVYDVMRREVVELRPREPGRVGMYVCGPTVYGPVHIGNARTLVWFDMIRRYLRYRGFDVTYVMNYTDVDDKIIDRARIEGTEPDVVAKRYAAMFERDMAALGAQPPDILVRATDHIPDMIGAIRGLIDAGLAYRADGDVFFAVERFPDYGKLSRRSLDEMRAGERVDPHPGKRHPLDFALWKAAKPGEPAWDSPWGPGRPGWHIECSVMSTKYLGMGFDIHGGAGDLIFPHHENEIAQAEGLAGHGPFVRYWLHAGLVQMAGEKMSKSVGNIVSAGDVVAAWGGEVARYWALSASYRTQVVFSEDALTDARAALERWRTFAAAAGRALGAPVAPRPGLVRPPGTEGRGYPARFVAAMDDDFNSAGAFATIHELVRTGNRLLEPAERGDATARDELGSLADDFAELTGLLGFRLEAPEASSGLVAGLVELLLRLREEARASRDFGRADAIRSGLGELGVVVEDTPSGPRWHLSGGPED